MDDFLIPWSLLKVQISGLCLRAFYSFFFNFIYLFLERGEGREKRERKSLIGCLWHALKGGAAVRGWQTWPSTQACALTRNRTGVLLGLGMIRNPLSHTGQGRAFHSSSL